MFSPHMKKEISDFIQELLKDTRHHELPDSGEIRFLLHVDGEARHSYANIRNESDRHVPAPDNLIRNTQFER